MARIRPFRALRPYPELAAKVASPPYDVLSSDEARVMADGNPVSFLHVNKPEIDLPQDTDPYAPEVYAKGAENLGRLIEDGVYLREEKPALYLYRQVMGDHVQTGIAVGASVEEYETGRIKKHEHTRQKKEDDRTRHIDALDAHDLDCLEGLLEQADTRLHKWITGEEAVPAELDTPLFARIRSFRPMTRD